jgi:CheY-like chemotaxis protein
MSRPSPVVLTVDKHSEIRQHVASYLQVAGCTFVEADSAASALATAIEKQPRMILLDVDLTDGSALEFLKSIREDAPQLSATKIVLVSREVRPQVVAPFIQHGACDFILKPFRAAELYAKLNKSLNLWKGAVPEDILKQDFPWPNVADDGPSATSGAGAAGASTSAPRQVASAEGANAEAEEDAPRTAEPSYVTLPASATKSAKAAPTEGERKDADCLVIDDMANVARRFRDLVPSTILVEAAATAEQALAVVRTKAFRVVLIDLQLPETDAGMLLRQISLFQGNATFFAMGLKTAANLVEDARTLGFDGVLTKPFESSKVVDLVDRYFDTKDKISVDENIVKIAGAPPGSDRLAAFFYRICNDIPNRLELVAEACYTEVIIDAQEVRGNRKSVIEVLVKLRQASVNLGLELYLVVSQEVVGYSKEFVETRSLSMYPSVEEAQQAIAKAKEGGE